MAEPLPRTPPTAPGVRASSRNPGSDLARTEAQRCGSPHPPSGLASPYSEGSAESPQPCSVQAARPSRSGPVRASPRTMPHPFEFGWYSELRPQAFPRLTSGHHSTRNPSDQSGITCATTKFSSSNQLLTPPNPRSSRFPLLQ